MSEALRFCANLDWLFTERPLLDRFAAAAESGFRGVELLNPYAVAPSAIRRRLDEFGLTQVLFNSPSGDRARGERGMACIPGRETQFRDSVLVALDYAASLDCRLVHLMGGVAPDDVAYETATALYADNIAWAAEQASPAGVRLAIEAINGRDIPGYVLRTQEQAAALVTSIGPDKIGLQFDIYHCQTAQGDVSRRLETFMPLIAHIQVADVPHRHEPGTGEIGWDFLFTRIRELGYGGWVGCEYGPRAGTTAGLSWLDRFGGRHG